MPAKTPASALVLLSRRHRGIVQGGTVLVLQSLIALLLFLASQAHAMPLRYTFEGLVEASDLIIVGRVDTIRGLPVLGNRWAGVGVREVWKGPMVENVEFLASRRREDWPTRLGLHGCYAPDMSDARRGETVLLFLAKEPGVGWVIINKGQGRIPLHKWNGKEYASLVPAGMPNVEIPDGKSGSTLAVDLATLRDSARRLFQDTK